MEGLQDSANQRLELGKLGLAGCRVRKSPSAGQSPSRWSPAGEEEEEKRTLVDGGQHLGLLDAHPHSPKPIKHPPPPQRDPHRTLLPGHL